MKNKIIVSPQDENILNSYSWYIGKNGYATTNIKRKKFYLHRIITNCPKGMMVDHLNRIKLDNRRENLRVCTPLQNVRNRDANKNCISGNRGVTFLPFEKYRRNKKFLEHIMVKGKNINLGYFYSLEEAILARKEADIKYGFISKY